MITFGTACLLLGPEHTGHFVQPHVAAHCGGDIYSRRKPLFSSFGEHTAVCGSSVRQAVARPRHRQSVCIHNIHVAATCRPSVLGSATMRGHMWLNKVASALGPLGILFLNWWCYYPLFFTSPFLSVSLSVLAEGMTPSAHQGEVEDLIHLSGPLTEDAVLRTLSARFCAVNYFVSNCILSVFEIHYCKYFLECRFLDSNVVSLVNCYESKDFIFFNSLSPNCF